MSYGVTASGFVIKPLSVIQEESTAAFRAKFGEGINLDPQSPLGVIKGILDERLSLLWQLAEAVYNSQYPATAEGVNLDNVAALTGIVRKPATYSTCASGRARGTFDTLIPAETIISVNGNAEARFKTLADAEISVAGIDAVQTITPNLAPDAGTFTLSFKGAQTTAMAHNASATDIRDALEALDTIEDVNVTGTLATAVVVTFQTTDGAQPQPLLTYTSALTSSTTPVTLSIAETTAGDYPTSPLIELQAEAIGAVQAPTGSLTVIETPVVGLDSFTNESAADVGSEIETDAELKIRRIQELQLSGGATLNAIRADVLELTDVDACAVFENSTDTTDGEGRPPHSVDVIVQGGADADIAEALFATVAAGIGYFGSVTVAVIDSQGFSHDIKFSRPTEVPMYVEIVLTTNADFPANGLDAVEAAIVAWGQTKQLGEDVVVFGSASLVAALSGIAGITDVAISLDVIPVPAAGSNVVTAANDAGELEFSWTAHSLIVGQRVNFTNSGGGLPTGITAGVVYWVVEKGDANTFKVSTTRTGEPVAYSSVGTGTHTVHFGPLDDSIVINERERATFLAANVEATEAP